MWPWFRQAKSVKTAFAYTTTTATTKQLNSSSSSSSM